MRDVHTLIPYLDINIFSNLFQPFKFIYMQIVYSSCYYEQRESCFNDRCSLKLFANLEKKDINKNLRLESSGHNAIVHRVLFHTLQCTKYK